MYYLKTFLTSLIIFGCVSVNANFKTFEAKIGESQWKHEGNLLGCNLSHVIPHYGNASFTKQAGKKQALVFNLSYKRQPITAIKVASVQSLSPSWLPRLHARKLGEIDIQDGPNIFKVSNTASWKLLNELEVGRFPTFRYQEFETIQDQVAVSLSAVGFTQPYDQFLDCLTSLVPYRLEELTKMTLRFDFNKHSVRDIYKEKLKALAAYIKFDPKIEVIFINGYTDSKGPKGYNRNLAEARVSTVQKILCPDCDDLSKFRTIAFGEKNPVASNRKASGRALNRRVYIRVSQH